MARADWILEDLLAHDAWIRALARKLVSDEHAAEDIAQEAWVEALEQPPSRPAKARPWLARVVRNLALKRRRTLERSQGREEKVARPVELPSAAELYEHEKTRYRVATEVFSLEEPYRTAILYRYFRGLKPREIADELGVSAAAVETRLRRGLEKLRARLDREFGDRASWCAALLPLIGKLPTAAATAAGSATGASLLTGALVMGTKLKIGLAALLVAASAVAFWAIWPRGTEVTLPRIPGADVDQPVAPSAKTAAAAEGAAAETAGADARTAEGLLHGSSDEIIPVPAAVKLVSLTGTVRSEDGKPIPDAVLTIEIDSMNDRVARSRLPAPRTTRTDAAGRYAFEELHPELSAWLTVSAAGFSQDALHVRAGDRQDIVLAVAGRIAGRVVDQESGQPVPRAVVWASNDSSRGRSGARSRKGEADAAGRFVIDDLRPGVYRLRTEAAHYLSDFRRSPHFVVQSRRTTEVELRLARGMTLRGQVLDARGGPVARARVGDRDPILTDAAGQFVLDGLESGAARIHIEADGKAPCQESVRFLQQEIAAGAAERTFRLVDAAILRGRVVGPDDHPVAGAGIRVRDYRPPIQADADGRFEVQLERPGKPQRFAVLAAGFAPVLLEPMTVAAGEIREDLVVKLTRGGAIEGRVETEAGAPISGQTVLLQTWPSRGMGLASAYRVTTTAADGRFRFDALAAGGYELSANGLNLPDREFATRGGRRDIRVAEGETMTGIVLVPTPRVALRGQTLDDRNRPLAGVRVVSWCGPSRAWSDENGRFTLEGMPLDCPCTFEVWKDDYTLLPSRSSLPGTVAADTPDLLIRMAPIPPGIRGHVLRADTGAPPSRRSGFGSTAWSRAPGPRRRGFDPPSTAITSRMPRGTSGSRDPAGRATLRWRPAPTTGS
ncbi:MAG: sigma-70 family RNA polymerase sigma factor [Planctomycetes bacterium]|nr:sigma-70 family RNA polymerase sigma factor [Planctomycetota bacterium]